MKSEKKKKFTVRRFKNWVLSLIGLTIILMAISFTVLRVAIKSIPDYASDIEKSVSNAMDITVEVGIIDAEIYWLVPRLNLFDVNIYNKNGSKHLVHLDEIDLSLDWRRTLKTFSPVIGEVTLNGLNVQLGINNKSQLLIQDYVIKEDIDLSNISNDSGTETSSVISDEIKLIINNLNFKIQNSQIHLYDDRIRRKRKTLTNFNLTLLNDLDEHLFEVKADLPERYGKHARFVINLKGDLFDYESLNGKFYFSLKEIHAAPWLDDYWEDLGLTANASINAEVWADWSQQKLTDISSRIKLKDIAVHYLDDEVKTWKIDKLDALMRWTENKAGWQLDVRDLLSTRNGQQWPESSNAMIRMKNKTREMDVQADFIRLEALVYFSGMINSLVDIEVPELLSIHRHQPTGDLKFLDINLPIDDPQNVKINTKFKQIGFSMPDFEPSKVSNLQGAVVFNDNKTWLMLDSNDVQLNFNKLFRNPIELKNLNGVFEISSKNNILNLSTNNIQIDTPHISTKSRIRLNKASTGKIFLDLTTKFKDGDGSYTSLYLPAGIMGPVVVPWLDEGVIKGDVRHGGYQFYGYLSDAPFRQSQGISLVDFYVDNADLRFLKNWPLVNNISAQLRFENDTMLITANEGRIFDSKINNAKVYIDNFISPTLDIKGNIDVQLPDVKKFINESGLREMVTPYINNLELTGAGNLGLELFLPLYGDFKTEVGGMLDVSNGALKFSKENYLLTDLGGKLRFAGKTVESMGLKAKLEGQDVDINISTSQLKNKFSYQMSLKGDLFASSLMEPVPDIKKYMKGISAWDINVEVLPENISRKTSIAVELSSDLKGVVSSLPGPLEKKSKEASPVEINIDVLPGLSSSYELKLNNGSTLGVKDKKNDWFIYADTPAVKGTININKLKNINSVVEVELDHLDLNKFFKSNAEKPSINDKTEYADILPRDIPPLDVFVKKLNWKTFSFVDSHLETQQTKQGMSIIEFQLDSQFYEVTGKGNWISGWNNKHTTDIDAYVKISDLGQAFKELEISEALHATRGNMNMRWNWRDKPYEFSWGKIKGDGSLNLKDGTMKQLDAGAGRLLGLFNFKTLLSLDFKSQLKEGYKFDTVKGSFSFSDGKVYSDDFTVKSKVADLSMKGSIGIVDEVLQQKVTVRPHLGATVTLGTTVVAGPVAGGVVYLFQKVFDTGRLTEYQYLMTGTLSEPDVKLLAVPDFINKSGDEGEF